MQINQPNAEIVILGDFNVHNINWLIHSNITDEQGREAEPIAISCGLTQLIDESALIPDRDEDFASSWSFDHCRDLDKATVKPLLESSDHKLISTISELPTSAKEPPKPRRILHYRSAK